jgi:hypothetical protein
MEFLHLCYSRNEALFIFAAVNFSLALFFFVASLVYPIQLLGANAWYKPIKFALSIGIYSITLAWFTGYLEKGIEISIINGIIILTLGFEIIYIGIQAGRGEMSHFKIDTPFYSSMYALMATAAAISALVALYLAIRFFTGEFPALPDYYLWSIRLGLFIFVLFAFEGFVMGSQLTHTIGVQTGGELCPF